MKNRTSLIILLFLLAFNGEAQKAGFLVNGEPLDNNCSRIVVVYGKLDTIHATPVKIYNAEISDNCLEISIFYGGGDANMELVTDNRPVESQSTRLYFLLKYISYDGSKINAPVKLKFDLSPFKNTRTGLSLFITLMGTNYSLRYDNFTK